MRRAHSASNSRICSKILRQLEKQNGEFDSAYKLLEGIRNNQFEPAHRDSDESYITTESEILRREEHEKKLRRDALKNKKNANSRLFDQGYGPSMRAPVTTEQNMTLFR